MKDKLRLVMAACLLLAPIAFPGEAAADRLKPYLTDGTKEIGPGVYSNPADGVCVLGLKFDGTLDVDTSIDNFRDCAVATTPTIKALGQTACTGGAGNDGYKHAWSTSICVDGSNNPISRVDLDNTAQMCLARGGSIRTAGLCVAYGWQYMNSKPGETIPYRSTITPAGYKGRTSADNLGFCYAATRMTSVPGYNVATNGGCPSYHNVSGTASAGEWVAGTDGVLYQTQASYDAGLGWSFSSSQCVYAYGVRGYVNGTITRANGTTITANTYVDTTTTDKGPGFYTTMGECLANGYSWDNWLPAPPATLVTGIGTTLPSDIMKLDSLTPIASGGGQFYTGTGSVCQKCHSDQSRSYAERNKPGFPESGHKLAGDNMPGTFDPSTEWGLKGVQCTICHATGRPTQQDVGLIVSPNLTGTNAGLPRGAGGHNNTEYGSHLTGVCYYCHGTKTTPDTGSPAAVIPVSGGDFAPTSKNLAPIANQFLNSPHAKYTGDSKTVNVITKTNYGSSFVGYICRSDVGDQSRTYSTSALCAGAGLTWTTGIYTGGNVCVHSAASCAAAGLNWDTSQVLYTGVPGVCSGLGVGSILTTVYQGGAPGKIHLEDSVTNTDCTNLPGATPSGAGGYVVKDGEAAGTSNGVAYVASDQGSCMTCHDVHWSMKSTDPEAEPLRRECTTCHSHPSGEASATSAPQIDLSTINHLGGAGTPLASAATDPNSACEICHMPKSSPAGSPMHLWRINTDSTYTTMGATKANTYTDGTYANAAAVDVAHACGQCHTSGPGPTYTTAQLAGVAKGMHAAASVTYPVTFTASLTGVHVVVNAIIDCGGACPAFTYDWSWGDATANGTGNPATHDYTTIGPKTITLTVTLSGKTVGTSTRTVTTSASDLAPTAAGTCTWNANTWTMTVVDASTDDGPDVDALPGDGNAALQIVLDWGDNTLKTITTQGSTTSHTYARLGSFTVTDRANDKKLQTNVMTCGTATPAYFTIAGTVYQSNGTKPVKNAKIRIKRGGKLVMSLVSSATGTFTSGAILPPGDYMIYITKSGFTFGWPAWSGTIGPSATGFTIKSTIP